MNKKTIRVTLKLSEETFNETGNNVLTVDGLRVSFAGRHGGGAVMPKAEITIYGLRMETMLQLMRIRWQDLKAMRNRILVEAGDQGRALRKVFEGDITFAYIDTSGAPEIGLRISSITGIYQAYKPVEPTTYQGKKLVVEALKELTEAVECEFVNNGVNEELSMENVMLVDTNLNKIRKICKWFEIDHYIENDSITYAPLGTPREIKIPIISPQTGLVGYPTPTIRGVDFRTLWNPDIHFGGIVRIQGSLLTPTNGDWRAFGVMTHLESETPEGNWFTEVQATYRDAKDAAISR